MSRKIIMKQETCSLLKMRFSRLIRCGKSWSDFKDDEKSKMLDEINENLERKFTIEEMDKIWKDINMNPYDYKYICIIDEGKAQNGYIVYQKKTGEDR